ncbi:MAG: carboxypeptidase regulatory-like domain-containing protein [Gemmatimonadaceae bacterium]
MSIFLAAVLAGLLGPQVASAQQVRGRLLDLENDRPIPSGLLTLLAADGSMVVAAVSDADGNWRLKAPGPGTYYVAARRLGYRPWVSAAVKLEAGDDWSSVFHLQSMPIRLDPITANAAAIRQHLEFNGFFERQRSNFGHFVTPEAIERRQAARITDLLNTIPGVQLVVAGGGNVGPAQISLRGSSSTDAALCRPRVYVDGLMYARGDSRQVRVRATDATEREDIEQRMDQAFSLDDIGHPSTIAAIEVYRSATQVPVQFGGTSVETLCGVIVIWTRTGRTPTPRDSVSSV